MRLCDRLLFSRLQPTANFCSCNFFVLVAVNVLLELNFLMRQLADNSGLPFAQVPGAERFIAFPVGTLAVPGSDYGDLATAQALRAAVVLSWNRSHGDNLDAGYVGMVVAYDRLKPAEGWTTEKPEGVWRETYLAALKEGIAVLKEV